MRRRKDALRRMRVELRNGILGDHRRWSTDAGGEGAAFARRTLRAIRYVLLMRRLRLPPTYDVRVSLS